jgi:zinc transporter ZupT
MFYFLFAAGLALIHIWASRLRFLDTIPRNRWLSIAGGASVAYVFVHIFPELRQGQQTIEQTTLRLVSFLEHHVYLLALIGFAIFYGLEQLAHHSRKQQQEKNNIDATSPEVFWLHIGSFSLYNTLIGYLLLHREETGLSSLFFFFVAMGLHFLVNDHGLREHHKSMYDKIGRWILAGAIFLGWILGNLIEVNEAALAVLFAFLAGGIILNVIKEELPEERQSQFWAFALGATVYASLLIIV